MKHAFSTDPAILESFDDSLALLTANCTRTQSIQIRHALEMHVEARNSPLRSNYPCALAVAAQLKSMRADAPILVAALLGNDKSASLHSIDLLRDRFGQDLAELVAGVRWLNELIVVDQIMDGRQDQAESLRRMVLTMVNDVRVVLVKLAYRTQRLYKLVNEQSPESDQVARETLEIYAPIANRLGLGQLKWELEDSAFRIVDPATYKRIAKSLEENRASRETYINDFVSTLGDRLQDNGIAGASVFGRPKHIYSIWRKMTRKRLSFNELFDVRAVRVLVDDLSACYSVLGVVHSQWQPITREFDDYIAKPKENGYRSLHTAVIGPGGKAVEIQIRTRDMDDHAENGFAAHWAYKEGAPVDEALQRGINALRQLLDDDDDEHLIEGFSQQLDALRVYVFTPKGEVVDLANGSTPLDFAYQIHSEIGHRCRGARINGRIVPLTYVLQNGDRVEVLTSSEPAPSRDWLNRSLGYLYSSRARSKIRAWFNARDLELHVADGKTLLDREIKRLKAHSVTVDKLLPRFRVSSAEELYAGIGRHDISMAQIAGAIDKLTHDPDKQLRELPERAPHRDVKSDGITVRGVGNLLTQMAACCQPVPPDPIVGFITRGKGVTIHTEDCSNMLNLREHERERLIEVNWGNNDVQGYPVEIRVEAYDRLGLIRDVSATLASLDVVLRSMNTSTDLDELIATMIIGFDVNSMQELSMIMDRVRSLSQVHSVERVV